MVNAGSVEPGCEDRGPVSHRNPWVRGGAHIGGPWPLRAICGPLSGTRPLSTLKFYRTGSVKVRSCVQIEVACVGQHSPLPLNCIGVVGVWAIAAPGLHRANGGLNHPADRAGRVGAGQGGAERIGPEQPPLFLCNPRGRAGPNQNYPHNPYGIQRKRWGAKSDACRPPAPHQFLALSRAYLRASLLREHMPSNAHPLLLASPPR